jgi:hypothetical protein
MATVLAVGNSQLSSAPFPVAAAGQLVLALINAAGGSIGAQAAPIAVELQVGAIYMTQGYLTPGQPSVLINGGGGITNWRVTRPAGGADSAGVESL